MSVKWMTEQLSAMAVPPKKKHFQPCPKGVVREGSTTHAVLAFLMQHPHTSFNAMQLKMHIDRTDSTIGWALHVLKAQKLIEVYKDGRNERYHRYKAKKGWGGKE